MQGMSQINTETVDNSQLKVNKPNPKPEFKYAKLLYGTSAVLTIPLLIDICTACHLFSLWIAWLLFFLIVIVSGIRLWFAFSQHLYKFAWGLIGQLLLGAGVLIFFQLSYNRVIETPVSDPVTPAVVDIANPIQTLDSVHKVQLEKQDEKDMKDGKTKNSHASSPSEKGK